MNTIIEHLDQQLSSMHPDAARAIRDESQLHQEHFDVDGDDDIAKITVIHATGSCSLPSASGNRMSAGPVTAMTWLSSTISLRTISYPATGSAC